MCSLEEVQQNKTGGKYPVKLSSFELKSQMESVETVLDFIVSTHNFFPSAIPQCSVCKKCLGKNCF